MTGFLELTMSRHHLTAAALAAALALIGAGSAQATTFCVPDYSAACPNNGTNVKLGSLETAMQANQSDGVKDTIHVAAGVITESGSIETDSGAVDALEIIGAGPESTVVTTSSTGNIFVMNIEPGARAITMRNLTVRVPASIPEDLGAAMQAEGATLDNVDIDVRNDGGDGISFVGGGTFVDGRIAASSGGELGDAIRTNGAETGPLTVERSRIEAPSWGIYADSADVPVTVRRTVITDPLAYAVRVTAGGSVGMSNSVITSQTARPITVLATAGGGASFTGDHLTIVGLAGQSNPAVAVEVGTGVTASASALLVNSIVRSFPATYDRKAPVGGATGNATIGFQHSNFAPTGTSVGDGSVTSLTSINSDPKFVGSGTDPYRLLPSSPSIDRANPAAGGLAVDLLGATRPRDGDADGTARSDQGAYEYQPPAPDLGSGPTAPESGGTTDSGTTPAPGGTQPPAPAPADTLAPKLTSLRLGKGLTRRRGGTIRFSLSEAARVELRFTRGKRTVTLRVNGIAGANTVKVAKRKLGAAAWRLPVVATDAAGHRASMARRVTVRR
ncbi:MAG: choice-of-anchor Q domain-containing protein [Baekduiaceae bacterium]